MWAKFLSLCFVMFVQRALIAHSESVLMLMLAMLGAVARAVCMARSSAVMFDCMRFQPTGLEWFRGLLGLSHTPMPAWALVEPFEVQEPSM